MAKNNEITKSELAAMIKHAFAAADKRIDAKFEAANKRTDAKFEESDKRMAAKFEESDKRMAAKFEESDKRMAAKFEESDKRTIAMFKASDKRTDEKIETLAEMVANGFYNTGERIDLLKQGQERIEMRLNNVAYRTELDAVVQRVEILEKQIKIVPKNA